MLLSFIYLVFVARLRLRGLSTTASRPLSLVHASRRGIGAEQLGGECCVDRGHHSAGARIRFADRRPDTDSYHRALTDTAIVASSA
jgi:hypothetical protein